MMRNPWLLFLTLLLASYAPGGLTAPQPRRGFRELSRGLREAPPGGAVPRRM